MRQTLNIHSKSDKLGLVSIRSSGLPQLPKSLQSDERYLTSLSPNLIGGIQVIGTIEIILWKLGLRKFLPSPHF